MDVFLFSLCNLPRLLWLPDETGSGPGQQKHLSKHGCAVLD